MAPAAYGRFVGAVLMLASACERGRESSARGNAHAAGVEWAGCAVVRAGPRCEMGKDRTLVVWSPGPDAAKWRFATDRGPLAAVRTRALQDGTQAALEVPSGAHAVRGEA